MSIFKFTRSGKQEFLLGRFREQLEADYKTIARLLKEDVAQELANSGGTVTVGEIDDICESCIEQFRRVASNDARMFIDLEFFGKGDVYRDLMQAILGGAAEDTFGIDAESAYGFGPDAAMIVTVAVNAFIPKERFELGAEPETAFDKAVSEMANDLLAAEIREYAAVFADLIGQGVMPAFPTYIKMMQDRLGIRL